MLRQFWNSLVHPQLPVRLLLLCIFLLFSGLGYGFKVLDSFSQGNYHDALLALFALCVLSIPALGLLQLKPWAWKAEIVFLSLSLGLQGFLLLYTLTTTNNSLVSLLITSGPVIFLNAICLAYLLKAECRLLFQR